MEAPLDEDAVRHVAHLARLKVTDDEVVRFAEQLSNVLQYVDRLNELDTRGIPPTAHALPVSNVFREDVPRRPWPAEKALHNAPKRHNMFFLVPKVLDREGT